MATARISQTVPMQQSPSMWIKQWLDKPENSFMCTVDETFIRDRFNLIGLDARVPHYELAINIILDEAVDIKTVVQAALAAELLYGLMHARFVMTPRGVAKMLEKYVSGCFGNCPRVNCEYSPVLPIGIHIYICYVYNAHVPVQPLKPVHGVNSNNKNVRKIRMRKNLVIFDSFPSFKKNYSEN